MRFLRKRLRMPSKKFAAMIGLSDEQYSRLENGAPLKATIDKLARLIYGTLEKLPREAQSGLAARMWNASMTIEERIVARSDAEQRWIVARAPA